MEEQVLKCLVYCPHTCCHSLAVPDKSFSSSGGNSTITTVSTFQKFIYVNMKQNNFSIFPILKYSKNKQNIYIVGPLTSHARACSSSGALLPPGGHTRYCTLKLLLFY